MRRLLDCPGIVPDTKQPLPVYVTHKSLLETLCIHFPRPQPRKKHTRHMARGAGSADIEDEDECVTLADAVDQVRTTMGPIPEDQAFDALVYDDTFRTLAGHVFCFLTASSVVGVENTASGYLGWCDNFFAMDPAMNLVGTSRAARHTIIVIMAQRLTGYMKKVAAFASKAGFCTCLLYTSPSPRDS